ncbi:hypothetical protein JXA12_02120 [Candidatus Woesearchaeota archaeon]|nr:hypothetical protein [Candidatus Woesearchaeota archaeon]
MKRYLPLILILIVACTPQPAPQQLERPTPPQDSVIEQRQEILESIEQLGDYLSGDVINATRNETDIRFTMSNGDEHVMDIATGIVYCTYQQHRGMRCHEAYFTHLEGCMVVDTQQGFSCVTHDGTPCDPAVTEHYRQLKASLLG